MSKKEEQQMDNNLLNYKIEGVEIPFSLQGLVEITDLLTNVVNSETKVEKEIPYQWFTKDGKTFGGQPNQAQLENEELGLKRTVDRKSLVENPFKEVITPLGANANVVLNAIYGFIEENIKNGKIEHKGKEATMGVVKD